MSCLMNFGEINIPSSRAFWDDSDDEDTPNEASELGLDFEEEWSEQALNNIGTLFVLEGKSISDFANKVILPDSEKVCRVRDKNVSIHCKKKSNLFLAIIEENLNCSGEVLQLLLPIAKVSQKVVMLSIKPKVEFKNINITETVDKITFIRHLNGDLNNIQPLNAPNFISGVIAGIACYFQNVKDSVHTYIAYTDAIPLDKMASQTIIKTLHQLDIPCQECYTPKAKSVSLLYT